MNMKNMMAATPVPVRASPTMMMRILYLPMQTLNIRFGGELRHWLLISRQAV